MAKSMRLKNVTSITKFMRILLLFKLAIYLVIYIEATVIEILRLDKYLIWSKFLVYFSPVPKWRNW